MSRETSSSSKGRWIGSTRPETPPGWDLIAPEITKRVVVRKFRFGREAQRSALHGKRAFPESAERP